MSARDRIVTESLQWIGTPYKSRHYPVRGHGCDCASLLLGVAMGAGLVPDGTPLPAYSADRHLHKSDEAYLATLVRLGFTQIDASHARAGDVLMFVMGSSQPASHTAILVEDEPAYMVHAYQSMRRVARYRIDDAWRRRLRYALQFPGANK